MQRCKSSNGNTDALPSTNSHISKLRKSSTLFMAWLRINQPDIMTTDEGRKKGFAWYADINNDSSLDVSISLLLTERTLVKESDGALHVENIPEPPPPEPVARPVEMWSNGERVSKWDE
ncbi:putative prophage, tail completion protein [Klebsiella variicola]|nr:putative prophage, tail completion protein [Klebsiella variicola]SLW27663.1 putative prophage, tail completion protein [Klebsiella variicola]SLZ51255.1 putative prophage, tail completion protein [Klebsiella variicola]SLZ80710.1 putative prophage, tail completion protein [Klebsiella variicola]SLZ81421.1 putative prophage, tail completion protein [Klebsiella variicola]